MASLIHYINDLWYREGCVDADVQLYCWVNGHWSWDDIIDSDGNTLDSIKVITKADLQSACDELGLDIDCLNW